MNKFLNVCFKIGKSIIFIFLGLCLIAIISSICILPRTFSKVNLASPTFNEILNNSNIIQNSKNDVDYNYIEPYKSEFDKIKQMFSDYGQKMFLAQAELIDDEYRVQYVKDAGVALDLALKYCKTVNLSERKCSDLFEETLTDYNSYFKRNITRKQFTELKQKTERIVLLISLASSVLLFILFLAIALLIKIEENTRERN